MTSIPDPERRGRIGRGASAVEKAGAVLPASFYARPAEVVARELIGTVLVSAVGGTLCSGRIVETEAYIGPEDEASHAAARIGRTRRNEAMFGRPGIAYVYRIYGIHWCLNAVTNSEGHPAAVLIRAAEPLSGVEVARSRRGRNDRDLMRGPGNLCAAFGIDGSLNHHPLQKPPLTLSAGDPISDAKISRGPRVGITRSADLPLRFWLSGSSWVSGRSQS